MLKTKPNGAWFWSGRFATPFLPPNITVSVESIAGHEAFGADFGTTLEDKLDGWALEMPDFTQRDPKSTEVWENASKFFAEGAEGVVHVILGPQRREGNVFDTMELPALQANPKVDAVIAVDPFTGETKVVYAKDGFATPETNPAPAPEPQSIPETPQEQVDDGYDADDDGYDSDEDIALPNAPRGIGPNAALPAQQLPSFVQNSQALGTIAPTNPTGDITTAVNTMLPGSTNDIQTALNQNFESFLGNGRNFPIKVGNQWFEANVQATILPTATNPTAPDIKTKVDLTTNSGTNTGNTNTIGTSGSVGAGATIAAPVGPYGSVAGSAQLATPVQSTNTGTSTTDQRAIRAGLGEKTAVVPVDYKITITDANLNPVNTQHVNGDVTLHIPDDIGDMTPNPDAQRVNLPNDVGPKIEHAAPEAVELDTDLAFNNIAAQLHPSITKLGAPGRTDLQNFLDPTTIRDNLGAALNGWVTSPDLVSPHGSRGGVVRMKATPVNAILVGTNTSTELRLHESVSTQAGVSSSSKSGFDVNVGVGGGATVAGQVGGTAGLTGGVSSKTAVTANAGTSTSVKTGMKLKGDTGVYQVEMNLEFQTPHGSVTVPVTTHMRMGLPEAKNVGLPTPDATPAIATPTTETRHLPPYLASAAAAGHVKVGELANADQVQTSVENALRAKFGDLLPNFNTGSNPQSTGKNMADLAEMMNNQRKLNTELSPLALKSQMDSLLGPGVQVQLKKQGFATNEYVNVTVKARLTDPQHVGQADNRFVRNAASTGPKLDSSGNVQKGWNAGIEGRVVIPSTSGNTSATPTPSVGAKYNSSTNTKTGAGPTVGSTSLNTGSPNAQLFTGNIEFDIEITSHNRNRSWVKRLTPGSPFRQVPAPTKVSLPKINGTANLWVSDSAAMKADPAQFQPSVPPNPTKIDNPPSISDLLTSTKQNASKIEKSPWLHVEAVANAEAVRDAAIQALNTAAKGDSVLTIPGTEARNRIDKMLSPESLRANLRTLVDKGMTEGGMKYDRRVYDRSGALGVSVKLGQPRVVSISDNVGTENASTGGFKAGDSKTTSNSVDVTAGLNTPMRPATGAKGSGAVGANAKWTPYSKSSTQATEVGGSVDRNRVTPADGRTVLLQLDATFNLVGESREANTVHKGAPNKAGVSVDLPGGVYVRVSEDVARDMGLLDPAPEHTSPDFGTMQPPSTLKPGEPGSLGLGLVENAPNLTNLVPQLRNQLGTLGPNLLPPSVLNDSMNNLRRLTDLTSDASVKALMDSALDGGVPLLVHNPGTFGKDSYQVTLKATPGTPTFDSAVNDGVEIEHTISGTGKVSDGSGKGTGWGVGVRVPGAALPGSANPNISGNVGGFAAAGYNQSHSTSTTNSTTNQVNHLRAGSGPAVKYNVPVTFELVVEKGTQQVGRVTAAENMTVRLLADNQSVNPVASPAFNPTPTPQPAAQGNPNTATNWQQQNGTNLPPTASVENFRGAQALQDAALQALNRAGANTGITGKGTGSLNALKSGLSSESLQPNLPGMLDGAFEVPGLHEAALTFGQHANVKVYAKMVNPRLAGLSDGVRIENPRTTVSTTSSEVKHSETADVTAGFASGGVSSKNPAVGFTTGGAEVKHGGEDSSADSGGAQNNPVRTIKPDGRTGLVQFDVEYRVVADLGGGKVGVVDLTVSDSAQVRMTAPDAETALGKQFDNQLGDAQTQVKDAAAAWRQAEIAADQARHAAEPTVKDLTGTLRGANNAVYSGQEAVQTAEGNLTGAQNNLAGPQNAQAQAAGAVQTLQNTVNDLAAEVANRENRNTMAEQLLLGANLDLQSAQGPEVAAAQQAQQNAQALANRTAQALRQAQDQHNAAVTQLGVAQGNLTTANQNLLNAQQQVQQAQAQLELAQQRLQTAQTMRLGIQNQIDAAQAPVEAARNNADAAQQNWWNAKTAVEQEVARFNTPPSPADQNNQPPPPPQNQPAVAGPSTPNQNTQNQPPPPPNSSPRSVPPSSAPSIAPESAPKTPATAPRGPSPERSFSATPTAAELQPLVNDLVDANTKRNQQGYLPPVVSVTGANAQAVVDSLAAHGIEAEARPGPQNTTDVHVDWDLKRPEGYVPPAAPQSVKVTDTVITSPAPQSPSLLDDPSWKHSTAASADWFDARNPVSSQDIANARANTPVTTTVRGEDGGVLSNSKITPEGVKLKAWRGPIAYDVRTLDVNGVKVQDLTVKLHLDGNANDIKAVQERTRAGVEELFNQGNRLPTGGQLHVTVEFTDNKADAHGSIKLTDPDGRANQLNWPVDTDSRRLAHEVGHFLGLQDEYFETGKVKPIFQHQDGKGRVVNDNAPMTAGIDAPDVSLKPRNLWLIENRMNALASSTTHAPDMNVPPPNAPSLRDLFGRNRVDPAPIPSTSVPVDPPQIDIDLSQDFAADVNADLDTIFNTFPETAADARLAVENAGHQLDLAERSLDQAQIDLAENALAVAMNNLAAWEFHTEFSAAEYNSWLEGQFSDTESLHSTDDAVSSASEPSGPNQARRLEDVLPKSEWWRLYLDPRHHATAQRLYPDNPGSYYDNDLSPGFQASMEAAYNRFLNPENFATQRLNSGLYKEMHEVVTSRLDKQFDWSGSKTTGFPLRGQNPSPDVLADTVAGRPLMIDAMAFFRQGGRLTTQPIVMLDRFSFGNVTIRTNYHRNEVEGIVDAVFDRFYTDLENANTDAERFEAIGRVVRTIHIVHPFEDANRRLNVHVLLPRLLLEAGFQPVIFQDMDQLFQGGRSLEQIGDALARGQQQDLTDNNIPATAPEFEEHSDSEEYDDSDTDSDVEPPNAPPRAAPEVRVADPVTTAPSPLRPSVLDDLSWKHSPAASADWFDAHNPATSQDIADARKNAPISSTVRGEDAGVLSNSEITPGGIKLKAWRGPIAYDVRTLDVNGVPVKDLTVKVFLDGKAGDVQGIQDRTRAGVEELFNQGNRMPGGAQLHVTVEFTDNKADAHGAIKITEPGGRANQLNWPSDTDSRRLAHEVGHFLGLHDEYFETGKVKPIFQHQDGKGRVVNDNAPMTAGIDAPDASLKPRNLWLIENRMKALESFNIAPAPVAIDPNAVPPNTFLDDVNIPTVSDGFAAEVHNAVEAPKIDTEVPKVADTFVEDLFDDLDAQVDTAPRPPRLLEGEWSSPRPISGPLTPQRLQDEFGMPQVNQQRFQKLADRFNLVYDVRPTNPDSVRWLEEGAVPKPKDIKAKTISSLDVHLGASPDTIGLVGYFDPRQPDYDSLDPDVRERVRQRYENRKREFAELAEEFESLEAQGRYRIENGIVQANTPNGFRHITGDHDVYHIRRPDDGSALEVDDYDLDVWLLTKRNIGVQHGAHMYWEPQGAFQEKIFNDIVTRHQQSAPDAEPLIRFSPGQPPALVFADPPPVHTESPVVTGLRRDGGAEGAVLADLDLPHIESLMVHAQTFVDQFSPNPAAATPAAVAHVAFELHHNGAVAAETAAREIGDALPNAPTRHTALVAGLEANPAGQAVLALGLPPAELQDLMVHAATIANGVDVAQIALTLHNSGPVTARAVADALATPSGTFDRDAELPNSPTRRTGDLYAESTVSDVDAGHVITFNPETGVAEVMDPDGADRQSMNSFLDDMISAYDANSDYAASILDGYTAPVATYDYQFSSDGVEPQFLRHARDVTMQTRPGQFPSVLPVVQTGVGAQPPLMFAVDNTIALPLGDNTTQFKEFYATPEVIADAQARLKEVGSKLRLKVVPGNTVTHDGTTLLQVTPHFNSTPPGVCSEFSQGVIGGSHSLAIMRPPGGTPVAGKVSNGGPLVYNGTHEMAFALAQFAQNPLGPNSLTPQQVSAAMADTAIDPPLVGRQYGAALVPGTDARARLDAAAEQLGVNQFAWAQPGEAYVIQSIAAPDAQGANYGLNFARTGTGQQLAQVWGYHFGSVAVNSASNDMQITVETVRQGGYRKHLLDQAINENLRNHGHNLPAVKAWLQSQPGPPAAELQLVDALAVIQDSRLRLADPAVVGGDRQAAETALKGADLAARTAINSIAGAQLPQPGQMWFLGQYSKSNGDSFFDKWGHVDDPSAQMQVANPLVAVTAANRTSAEFKMDMADAKNLDPARVASGEQRLPGIANNMLTGLASTTVEAALWRHRNGMRLPEIHLHGYGNDRLHGTRTGQQRADVAAAWTRAEVSRLLDELQSDIPPAYRLGADQIRILPISHGRDVPEGSTNLEVDRRNVYARMTIPG
ncbi:hypothetical protein [Lentzea sp. NBRC 105346]|uniref:hypothetical protein n=1 Tax=Lentzea sp. NBRC 105346 TaxID=3032205 RepID=UPI00255653B4|nr:hypothetical protein [Lentzea sp. NBRC 105346]